MPDPNTTNGSTEKPIMGSLRSPVQESRLKALKSNLRDFLFERPVKVRGGQNDVFSNSGFGTGVKENLREFFKPTPRGKLDSGLVTDWQSGPTLWQNIKDLISPPKLPPLETTSEAVAVPEIWSKNTQFTRVQALSVAFHVVVLALIIGPFLPSLFSPATTKANNSPMDAVDISQIHMPPAIKKAGGGGGAHEVAPASRGRAPKFATQQIAVPISHPVEHPQIPMTPTLLGNPNLTPPNINASNWGDPLSHVLGDSMGNGNGTGIGNGDGGGLGNGYQNGFGGGYPTGGVGGYGMPKCVYCPDAQFSDEAVKAKYQGVVTLSAVVGLDGRATDVHVVKSLGLGLDENAEAAVKTWRFTPALGPDGKPSVVRALIEVTFHLY